VAKSPRPTTSLKRHQPQEDDDDGELLQMRKEKMKVELKTAKEAQHLMKLQSRKLEIELGFKKHSSLLEGLDY